MTTAEIGPAIGVAPLSLAHLTLLDESPPDLVTIAAATGYSSVGIRLRPVHPAERPWQMEVGTLLLRQTLRVLADTGLTVSGVEVVRIGPGFRLSHFAGVLESGAALGASTVTVFPVDPVAGRLTESVGALAQAAAPLGMQVLVEPMVYNSVDSLAAGMLMVAELRDVGVGLIIDALHFQRYGGRPLDLIGLEGGAVGLLQLSDGPLHAPQEIKPFDGVLPRGQSPHAPALALEGRAFRLLPGDGELPLEELVRALPTVPRSVEAPCADMQRRLPSLEIARIAYQQSQAIVTAALGAPDMQGVGR